MNAKMIVVDLDQTLLKQDKTLTERTAVALRRFSKIGHVVIASGRALPRIQEYAQRVNASGIVAMNGTAVYHKDQLIKKYDINKDNIKAIVNELLQIEGVDLSVWYPMTSLTNNHEYAMPEGPTFYSDFSDFKVDEISKICAFTNRIEQIKKIDFHRYGCKLLLNSHEPDFFIIMNEQVDKLKGLCDLCEAMNISLNEVIGFGDDYNDIEMLKGCGVGIAVDNAMPAVKEIADACCGSNEEDGVACWIEENLLK